MIRISRRIALVALGAFVLGVAGTLLATSFAPDRHELREPVPHHMVAGSDDFVRTMGGLYGFDVHSGNAITTLVNGDQIFPAMLEAIEAAERTINFETYVYWSGDIAQVFASTLARRAQEGIAVRVLLDWQGSVPMDIALIETMEQAGVRVERFRPIRWYTLDRVNNRTHRKLLLVDGRLGFTGGVGIADEWLGDARHPGEWRETHYRVDGPTVAGMQAAFADNWVEATGEILQGDAFFPPLEDRGTHLAQLVKFTTGERNVMHLMMMTALASARETIRIGTPYFVPDDIAMGQILDARARGVSVDILVPGQHMNKKIVRSASRHFWGDLLEAGVRFYEYDPTMYHAKITIVDEAWTSIGSANFDERSFRLNDEANLNVFDPDFAREQIAIFEDDRAHGVEITLEAWENRSFAQKFADFVWSRLRVQL